MDVRCSAAEQDKPIKLPQVTVEDFAVYAKFLYTGLLFTKEANVAELTRCLDLYKAARNIEAIDFQDDVQLDLLAAAAPFIPSCPKSNDMPDPLDLSRSCKYHEHNLVGVPCYKTKYQFMIDDSGSVAKNVVAEPLPTLEQDDRLRSC